ncbi:hemolysin family protein [Lysinibacillus sp. FSL K6-0057]|uniref:hemolysin family protein n=1 Tax=unclassified Lysinibacillus TaxID=2636778 RepID=UPI0031598504
METIINLSIFTILLALTGFFVATEFAIVKVRSSRLDQLVAEGNKKAIAAKHVVQHLDEYLSACQLGITVTALGIGMVGEKTFEFMLHPLFEMIGISDKYMTIFTIGTAFAIATFLHVVVGELAPKTAAIQKAESITLLFAKPIMFFYKIMYPFIWFLNGSARVLVGLFGMKPASEHELSHTEEELRLLLSESFKSGEINKSELKYVNNVFEFDERIAREIMVPRTEIVGIEQNESFTNIIHYIAAEKYTRYPIYDGDRDNILGFINAKELLTHGLLEQLTDDSLVLEDFINPVIRVIETIPVQELLVRMQKERIHMAILMDEYGGTSGLVTVEDILEEIVGEIRDEFDDDEIADIRKITDHHYLLNAKMLVEDVENLLNITLDAEEVETLGGWFLTVNNGIKASKNIELGSYIFSIYEQQGHQIHYIEVRPLRKNLPLKTEVQS